MSAPPTVAITRAPTWRRHCTAALATPPDADGTSTVSSACTAATVRTMLQAVETTHCAAAAGTKSSAEPSAISARAGTRTRSA